MKKRKTFIMLGIIIAVLVLGIGYAMVSNINLKIDVSTTIKANADFDVRFKEDHTILYNDDDTIDGTPVVTGAYTDGHNATMTVHLDTDHRVATATYRIQNYSDELDAVLNATISEVAGDYKDYITVEKSWTLGESDPFTEGTTTDGKVTGGTKVAHDGGYALLTVTVTLVKLPVKDVTVGQTFTVNITAEPMDSDAV